MNVSEVMRKKVVTVTPNTSFLDVWNLILEKHIHSLPVVDDKQILVGIIAIQDVFATLYPSYHDTLEEFSLESDFDDLESRVDDNKNKKASSFMCKHLTICYIDEPVLKAFSKMIVHRVRQLPVIDYDDKLLGIVSKRDIFDKFFIKKFKLKRRIRS